ncbi:prophage Lp2 protein 2, integrase [Lactobacillus plantarum subsp. plantarum ST-III] [Lactiplantibacillus mudanjiangensis]|uniref:tyrosine-type recombinase/integrase n=1 Tax=Lactiplantibacillus mudanjiangensis TaxID=1296538 RepID=UPI0010145500|nr:prophage Lp2 protein 2, integrase [Lactobacillus plantarum subsp. plantarum ST-III] [Lactiplantibacillus mudanjiangensis]
MASIQKKNGKWAVRVSYYDEFGKRHFKNKNGFARKREAEQWANELEQSKFNQSIGKLDTSVTFSDYYLHWLKTYKFGKLARITEQEYRYTLRQIETLLPNVKLAEMTRIRYQEFINKFTYGSTEQRAKRHLNSTEPYHSKSSVEKLHGHIHAAVIDAVADQIIHSDFCFHVELGGHKGKSAQLKYLDAKDMQKLVTAVNQNIKLTSTSKSMIFTGLLTGMRVAEVSALTWPDIDWQLKTVRVNKSWDYVYGQKFKKTKTESSIRTITVTDDLLNHLKQLHALQIAAGLDNPDHLVFLNNRGRIPTPGACDVLLKKYHELLGIKRISFHGLRHTHASYLLYRGVKMEYISKRLGHKNSSITRNVYAHLMQEDQEQEDALTISALAELN